MSTPDSDSATSTTVTDAADGQEQEKKVRLDLIVDVTSPGPCRKHVKVTISRADVDRQFGETLGDVAKDAFVPGFRLGKAPKPLVERRYRKEVAQQVKSALLMACIQQLDEDYKFNPISQPNLDPEAIELAEDGPMTFELDLEVPPDFEVPDYKTLQLKRPVRSIADADVDVQIKEYLEQFGQVIPKTEGKLESGDFAVANLTIDVKGQPKLEHKEVQFRVRDALRTRDAVFPKLGAALIGAAPGQTKTTEVQIAGNAAEPAYRFAKGQATIEVLDMKTMRVPELTPEFLAQRGYDSLGALRDAANDAVKRQAEFQQFEALRKDLLDQLLAKSEFALPPDLVERQERIAIAKRVQELKRGGLPNEQIAALEAEIRSDALATATRGLKEFFLLSKIAEQEKIEVGEEDLDREVELLANLHDETPRRVRAKIEADGLGEALMTQILERKVLAKLLESAHFEDVPMVQSPSVAAVDLAVVPNNKAEDVEARA